MFFLRPLADFEIFCYRRIVAENGKSKFNLLIDPIRREWSAQSNAYSSPLTTVRRYWNSYGGRSALFRSPYLHIAFLPAIVCSIWRPGTSWYERAIEITPSLLGLTLAGYAILLATGAGDFQSRLATSANDKEPVLATMNSAFLHFVMVQVVALFTALVGEAVKEPIAKCLSYVFREWPAVSPNPEFVIKKALTFVGWTLVFYSIACAIAAAFRVFRYVEWYIRSVKEGQKAK